MKTPSRLIHQLDKALNEHDIDTLASCIAENYQSEQPAHPERAFVGRDQFRKNWTGIFHEIPNIHSRINNLAVNGNQAWMEWEWIGTLADHSAFHWLGVVILTIENDTIASARLFMEPVESSARDINGVVKDMTHS